MPQQRGPGTVLSQVATRLRLAAFGRRFSKCVLLFSIVTLVAVLAIRLTGLVSLPFHSLFAGLEQRLGLVTTSYDYSDAGGWGLLAGLLALSILLISALLAAAWQRRPSPAEAARVIDSHQGTKDLFLTLTLLDSSAGDYQPLVVRDANTRAAAVVPRRVVPLAWSRGPLRPYLCLLAAVLVLGIPQLDPFEKVAEAEEREKEHKKLEKDAKKTRRRAEQLARDDGGENSPEVKKAIEELKKALQKMKKARPKSNQAELNKNRKKIGEQHNRLNAHKLAQLLNRSNAEQKFGQLGTPKLQKWTRELQEGSTESLKKQLEEIKKDLMQLARLDPNDPKDKKKRDELMHKMQKKLREVQSFASKNLDSKTPLAAALKRAKEQLKAMKSGDKKLAEEASKHLAETLDLTKKELSELAQTAKDLQELEKALEAIKMAQKANDKGELDGEMMENAETLDDYREFYEQLMAELGDSMQEGEGTGNKGFGKGGEVSEDDTAKTGFKNEVSKSALTAGKVLLSLKTKGQSDTGDARQAYSENIQKVKQGISEAIDKEEIPKGYVEGIKRYFDALDNASKAPPSRKAAATKKADAPARKE